MSHTYNIRLSYSTKFVAIIAMLLCVVAHAQSSAILDACNSIEDKDKRLACFTELANLKSSGASNEAAAKRVKNSFAAIAGVVNSGVSFNDYSAMLLEPAKEIEIFKQDIPTTNPKVLYLFDQALLAYHDAKIVWKASIYDSDNAGFFGQVLRPRRTGLQGIVNKYNLPTEKVLFNDHLPIDSALQIIWKYADERAKAAVDILDGRSSGVDLNIVPITPISSVQCDKWGNPKDINGNPCE